MLYNLQNDPAETNSIADQHPDIVEQIKNIMEQEHEFSEIFPFETELK